MDEITRKSFEMPRKHCGHICHEKGLDVWVESCPVCGCPNPRFNPDDTPETYRELPPRELLRVAKVSIIHYLPNAYAPHGTTCSEGAYILVPRSFPPECDLVITKGNAYAEALAWGARYNFIARPGATQEEAESLYDELKRTGLAPGAKPLLRGSYMPAVVSSSRYRPPEIVLGCKPELKRQDT